jgi:anthranilate phosphoribosyltransferase
MGIRIDLAPEEVPRCLEEVGCAFLFAPAYHTTFAVIAPVRRALAAEGRRTVFNLLGPLLNPARPDARLVGVFKPEHVALYAEALKLMGCPQFTVACGQDEVSGRMLGEVSVSGPTQFGSTVRAANGAPLTAMNRTPEARSHEKLDSLLVRNPDESASRLESIFSGEEQGLGRDTLVINAAVALWTCGAAPMGTDSMNRVREALDSGKALGVLKRWQKFSEKA